MPELDLWGSGRNPREHPSGASKAAAKVEESAATGGPTMESVVSRDNMLRALQAVERHAGRIADCPVISQSAFRNPQSTLPS